MSYQVMATSRTPALIIYLLDISASMNSPLGTQSRIDVVVDALTSALRQMTFRSTKGGRVSPRYSIAMYAYSDNVYDVLGGIRTVDKVVRLGVPELRTEARTDMEKAFLQVEKLLLSEIHNYQNCPAPLVCHMTDGIYTGKDPFPVVERIREMAVADGKVLVENIFISDEILTEPVQDPFYWGGITAQTPLRNDFAVKLRAISSPVPESYRTMMFECNYHIEPEALMLFPGANPDLVAMGFQMSAATPVR